MTFKTVSILAIATVSLAALVLTSPIFGFAELFASACVLAMLPLALEPLEGQSRCRNLTHTLVPCHEVASHRGHFAETNRKAA